MHSKNMVDKETQSSKESDEQVELIVGKQRHNCEESRNEESHLCMHLSWIFVGLSTECTNQTYIVCDLRIPKQTPHTFWILSCCCDTV